MLAWRFPGLYLRLALFIFAVWLGISGTVLVRTLKLMREGTDIAERALDSVRQGDDVYNEVSHEYYLHRRKYSSYVDLSAVCLMILVPGGLYLLALSKVRRREREAPGTRGEAGTESRSN